MRRPHPTPLDGDLVLPMSRRLESMVRTQPATAAKSARLMKKTMILGVVEPREARERESQEEGIWATSTYTTYALVL